MIHYSTDYVFDGTKKTPYAESDTPNPLNVYGRSKLAGEAAVTASGVPCLQFRTSWVYGATGKNLEADEVDVVAGAVLGYFEEIDEAEEAGCAGKLRGDVGKADGFDRVDLAFFHAVAVAGDHVGAGPDADAAGDFAAADAFAKALGEGHGESLARVLK
jgi:hypothetical protein